MERKSLYELLMVFMTQYSASMLANSWGNKRISWKVVINSLVSLMSADRDLFYRGTSNSIGFLSLCWSRKRQFLKIRYFSVTLEDNLVSFRLVLSP